MQPWKLADASYGQIKDAHYEVALLPLGATEPHNLHLPYGTDTYEGMAIAERACQAAAERGAQVMLLPAIPYGTETNQREFPFAMNVNPSTLLAVISDLIDSLIQSKIHKIVILNCHGGNDIKPMLREMYGQKNAQLFLCFFPNVIGDVYSHIFSERDDHAGEMETSLALAYFPQLVCRAPDGTLAADAGTKSASRFEAIERGWISITRPWHLLTTNSGAGNPHEASAEKGEAIMKVMVDRISQFLVELSATKIDARFPYF